MASLSIAMLRVPATVGLPSEVLKSVGKVFQSSRVSLSAITSKGFQVARHKRDWVRKAY